ncbi:type II toxin-antitoxin system VapC family toxin [Fibrisoma montanum]|uniref:type II toxin-antitoxin system VapC family toxin n=1 Tax=Fibrisoma montanum TaxID=2305895 RepID=UPI00131442B7|nr:type II toxin-antitoxin system VapC family toxin [Fibrisoma montanum]
MNILLDTNILIFLARDEKHRLLREVVNTTQKTVYVSIVSIAEVRSIAFRNRWSFKKLATFDTIISDAVIIDVSDSLVNSYVEIQAYSQRQSRNFTSYPFDTPRNMGKNDMWIASTAALLGLQLVTTDADFDHLNQVFLDVRRIDPVELRAFF